MTVWKMAGVGLSVAAVLSGCATVPMGPRVPAMPPANKPYSVFQQDDYFCRGQAANAVQGEVEAANNAQVGAALFTTILGAAIGAAAGGGQGAAIGAAAGAGAGTLYGTSTTQWQQLSIQQRYDIVYAQCMYAHGNVIPGYGRRYYRRPPPPGYAPPPPGYAPPPPQGPSDE